MKWGLRIFFMIIFFLIIFIAIRFGVRIMPLNPKASSIILDESCSPPCWGNITPGVTTRAEVKSILPEIPWVKKSTIKEYPTQDQDDSVHWDGSSKAGDYFGRVYFTKDVVSVIEISIDPGSLSFADVIAKLGDPESIFVFTSKAEQTVVAVFALYPTKGYVFLDYYTNPTYDLQKTIQIKSEEEVKAVWYCDTENYFNYLTSGPIDNLRPVWMERRLQKWNGYGGYEYIER